MTRFALAILISTLAWPALASNTISYQGHLQQQNQPFSGTANLDFRLFDAAAGGNQIGPIQERPSWPVSDGVFQVELDFGAGAFDGSARFLEIRVNGTVLIPRQAVTAAPQALIATTTVASAIGTTQINPAQVQRRVTGSCPAGEYVQSVNQNGTVVCGAEAPAWQLGGNAGTNSNSQFIGTTDDQPLELRIRNVRGLRLEPSAELFEGLPITANVIGGSHANEVAAGVRGATISGGGAPSGGEAEFEPVETPNRIHANYGAISGGIGNAAGTEGQPLLGRFSAVSGGSRNMASASWSNIAGGASNSATGNYASVGGGRNNIAGNRATVSGGSGNVSSAFLSTIGGGSQNESSGDSSTVGGGENNIASGDFSTVGGGQSNTASGDFNSTVSGGVQNTASGRSSTVSGGSNNCAGGNFTWAGGNRAKARPGSDPETGACSGLPSYPGGAGDSGTFIWADGQNADFVSSGSNQFLVRASGGIYLGTNSTVSIPTGRFINTSTGGFLSSGGVWTNSSSRYRKAGFAAVDVADVLDRILALPIQTWHYLGSESARHIGPVAEDFHALFGLGTDNESISTVDATGVALAAIQGLNQRLSLENAELRAEVAALQVQSDEILELKREKQKLTARVTELEAAAESQQAVLERLSVLEVRMNRQDSLALTGD